MVNIGAVASVGMVASASVLVVTVAVVGGVVNEVDVGAVMSVGMVASESGVVVVVVGGVVSEVVVEPTEAVVVGGGGVVALTAVVVVVVGAVVVVVVVVIGMGNWASSCLIRPGGILAGGLPSSMWLSVGVVVAV